MVEFLAQAKLAIGNRNTENELFDSTIARVVSLQVKLPTLMYYIFISFEYINNSFKKQYITLLEHGPKMESVL